VKNGAAENKLPEGPRFLNKRAWPRLKFLKKISQQRRAEFFNAGIFLALIILPGGALTYLSWRAIENEKLLAQERLQESYGQFDFLAARAIDEELKKAEKNWVGELRELSKKKGEAGGVENLDRFVAQQPLIASCFLLRAPGRVLYPPGLQSSADSGATGRWQKENYVHEHELFEKRVAAGEELEYRQFDLNGAIAVYRELAATLQNPRLRGIAESHVGRALLKQGEYAAAIATFTRLFETYPEERDLNGLHLRFLAQYQIAVAQENLGREAEALEGLLRLYQDLLERSDAVNAMQYSYFTEQIRALAPRLLSSEKLPEAAVYAARYRALAEQNKKRLSQKYFLQLFERKLNKMVIERKQYAPRFRYLSETADHEPYLLAYSPLPDEHGGYVTGLLGVQIDLAELRSQLFPAILSKLKVSEEVALAILNEKGEFVLGTERIAAPPLAVQALSVPFDFWQVAVYVKDHPRLQRGSWRALLWFWFIALMLVSILAGAIIFIRRARREARLSQMKSNFVSNVSHELRTPLASIKMMAELLSPQFAAPPDSPAKPAGRSAQYLSVMQRECDRLSRLIENVLNFSKIERGAKEYRFEYEDPAAVLRLALESFRPHAEAQGFTLSAELADDLPELYLDADAIVQVMLNLLGNAVKYSAARKEIRVRAHVLKDCVAVAVSDHGMGMAAKEIPKIFQEFYRVDQRLNTQQQGGMGLGLTLAHHIVNAHGGKFEVQSEPGNGSTFTFYLPAQNESLKLNRPGPAILKE